MKKLAFLLLLLLPLVGFSQKDPSYYLIEEIDLTKIDSTELVILNEALSTYHESTEDTVSIQAIAEFIEQSFDPNLWPKYNDWLKAQLEQKLQQKNTPAYTSYYERTMAMCFSNIGYQHMMTGEVDKALVEFKKCLPIYQKYNEPLGLGHTYNNIASIYEMQGKIEAALNNFQKTLEYLRAAKDEYRTGTILNNIAAIYADNGDNEAALKYYNEAIEYHKKSGDLNSHSTTLSNIAIIYSDNHEYEKSIKFHRQSLALLKNFPSDHKGIGTGHYNIGQTFYLMNLPDSAIPYFDIALEHFETVQFTMGIANCNRSYGNIYIDQKNYPKALTYYQKSYVLAQEMGFPNQISQSAKNMSLIYKHMGKWKEALDMYKLHIAMEDSVNNDAAKKAVAKQQAQYEYEKQKAIDDAQHEKQLAIEQEAKEKQQIITYATAGGLGLVGIFLIFVFNRLKVTRKQKGIIEEAHGELEEKNTEIMDSIAYAKRIQSAILPPDKLVKEYLDKSFVLYKPKDIVAGDFYWMEPLGNKTLFAAADCTGHGVPGAMVSVVCNNGLNRSVREHKLTDPGKILDKTREIVVQEFEKSEEEVKDGMDIALCCLEGNTLHYAGAHNPLWIIRKGATEIEEIKADKQPIGQTDNPTPYTTHKVELNQGDTFYIFSDGYADQFGGEKGKKLKSANFKKLLLSLANEDMPSQLALIDDAFESWKGELEQLDDVCVIGVRV